MTTAQISKAEKRPCEMCGKISSIRCVEAPTFYCSQLHFDSDWNGIRRLVFEETAQIRKGLPPTATSKDERRIQETEFAKILEKVKLIAQTEAKRNLIGQRFDLAVAAGLEALKMTQQLHLNESEIATCHLILAEANLGQGRLEAAEEFLNLAAANISERSGLTAQLQRSFGFLQRSQGKISEALRSFALYTYHVSLEFGPESYQSALGYLYMAETFTANESDKSRRMVAQALELYMNAFFWGNTTLEGVAKDEVIDAVMKIKAMVSSNKDQTADCEALIGLLTGDKEHADLAKLLYAESNGLKDKLSRINELVST